MTDLAQMPNAIRALAMDAVKAANSGHSGMPMGMADVATVLFTRSHAIDPSRRTGPTGTVSSCRRAWLDAALCAAHLTGYRT